MADLDERGVLYEYEPRSFPITTPVPRLKCPDCGAAITRRTRYTPDFLIRKGAQEVYIEAKGKFTPNDQRRVLAFYEEHVKGKPGVRFYMLFMRNDWLTKKHKNRNTDWCRKNGINCGVGDSIPEEWI